jgi:hypothetical protein
MCHVSNDGDFEKDDNKHKDIARRMLKMTFELNAKYFDGRSEVSCSTCHNGRERPISVPNLTPPIHEKRPQQPTVKESADKILDNYAVALGGKTNLAKISSRLITSERKEPDGKTLEKETIWQTSGKMRTETNYNGYLITEGSDGISAWKTGGNEKMRIRSDEAAQIKREAQLFANADLRTIYAKIDVRYIDKLGDREVVLVIAELPDGDRERLYFDTSTGLLVRRIASSMTVLGQFQYQVDYNEYREFGGVKLPTVIRSSMPNISWTRKLIAVKNNVPIDDQKFREPESEK